LVPDKRGNHRREDQQRQNLIDRHARHALNGAARLSTMGSRKNPNSLWRIAQDLLSLFPMREPSVRTSRLAIAGGLAAIIVVGSAGFILGRGTAGPEAEPAPPAVVAPTPTPAPGPEIPAGVLDRAALVSL